jgi:hypothetical protein
MCSRRRDHCRASVPPRRREGIEGAPPRRNFSRAGTPIRRRSPSPRKGEVGRGEGGDELFRLRAPRGFAASRRTRAARQQQQEEGGSSSTRDGGEGATMTEDAPRSADPPPLLHVRGEELRRLHPTSLSSAAERRRPPSCFSSTSAPAPPIPGHGLVVRLDSHRRHQCLVRPWISLRLGLALPRWEK